MDTMSMAPSPLRSPTCGDRRRPRSARGEGHHRRRIAVAGGRAERKGRLERRQLLGAEDEVDGLDVLFQVAPPLGARNGDQEGPLGQQPCQRELGWRGTAGGSKLGDAADELEVALEVVSLKTRRLAPVVVGGEVLEALELASQETAPERSVGQEADAEGRTGVEHPVGLRIT